MAYNYTGFVNELANLAGTSATNSYFVIELPNAIDYAEQRIYRELDLISAVTTDATQSCAPMSRTVQVPAAFVTVTGVNLITPAGTANPNSGTRNALTPVAQSWLDFAWPSSAGATLPTKYHWFTQGGGVNAQGYITLGPWPDQNYTVEYEGTQRPAPLSASNLSTFLTTYLPDLFLVAAMLHLCAYQKNWSALGDDPNSAATWEAQYLKLKTSADAEELRKRYSNTTLGLPPGLNKGSGAPEAQK